MTDDHQIIEHITVKCAGGQYNTCQDCQRGIPDGSLKHLWRMYLPNRNSWHRGSFWTKHCDECYKKSIIQWKETLETEINSWNNNNE